MTKTAIDYMQARSPVPVRNADGKGYNPDYIRHITKHRIGTARIRYFPYRCYGAVEQNRCDYDDV